MGNAYQNGWFGGTPILGNLHIMTSYAPPDLKPMMFWEPAMNNTEMDQSFQHLHTHDAQVSSHYICWLNRSSQICSSVFIGYDTLW